MHPLFNLRELACGNPHNTIRASKNAFQMKKDVHYLNTYLPGSPGWY